MFKLSLIKRWKMFKHRQNLDGHLPTMVGQCPKTGSLFAALYLCKRMISLSKFGELPTQRESCDSNAINHIVWWEHSSFTNVGRVRFHSRCQCGLSLLFLKSLCVFFSSSWVFHCYQKRMICFAFTVANLMSIPSLGCSLCWGAKEDVNKVSAAFSIPSSSSSPLDSRTETRTTTKSYFCSLCACSNPWPWWRDNVVAVNFVVPASLKTKKFEDFVVAKTECFVLVLVFVLVLESKAPYYHYGGDIFFRREGVCRTYLCGYFLC